VEQALKDALPNLLTADAEWAGNMLVMNPNGDYFPLPDDTPDDPIDNDRVAITSVTKTGPNIYHVVTAKHGAYDIKLVD
jgi:hypothetical protein